LRRHACFEDEREDDTVIYERFGHNLFWSDNHYIESSSEDASLILKKEDLLNAKTIKYYDGLIDPYSAKKIIDESTDEEIVKTCQAMADLSLDFKDDLFGWAKYLNGNSVEQIGPFMDDPKVGRKVMEMCGGGYTKLYGLYHKTLQKPDILFLNSPMSSLHPMLGKEILSQLEYISPDTTFVITDSNGFANIKSAWLEK
jgi:hypothetical protein